MTKNLTRLRDILVQSWPDAPPALPVDRGKLVTAVEMALAQRSRRVVVQRRASQFAFASAAALLLVSAGWKVSRYVDAQRMAAVEHSKAASPDVPGSDSMRILQAPEVDSTGGALVTRANLAGSAAQTGDRYVAVEGTLLDAGQTLNSSATAELRIGSARGTSLTLEPKAELAIKSLGKMQHYTLAEGSVRTRVAKLRSEERFILGTVDAEIEVHGTAFRVSLVTPDSSCGDGVRTRVAVTEGVVSVRSRGIESFLAVGEEWPRGCSVVSAVGSPAAAPIAALSANEPAGRPSGRHHHGVRRSHHRRSHTLTGTKSYGDSRGNEAAVVAAAPSSSLSAQNDLFTAGARARKDGRASESVHLFSDLVNRYPDSPLIESAMVQRIRAMRDTNPAGVADAVAEYLKRFPSGFARAELRRLASSVQ